MEAVGEGDGDQRDHTPPPDRRGGRRCGSCRIARRVRRRSGNQAGRARSADVVVVGAGLAGLTAARNVVKAGRSVVVLEARDRVGGRVLNHALAAAPISELGAMFIGPTQDRIKALATDVGVGTFPTYNTGNNVYLGERAPQSTRTTRRSARRRPTRSSPATSQRPCR